MEIERVTSSSDGWEIETTGAIYRVRRGTVVGEVPELSTRSILPVKTWIDLLRKIDPATNALNPRLVGRLEFQTIIEPFVLGSADKEQCVLKSKGVELCFHSDSLFMVENRALATLAYRYTNLIDGPDLRRGSKQPHSRLWTDGQGGALHALASGREDIAGPPDVPPAPDTTDFSMVPDERTAHMVFPARPFDFDVLYGVDARPFIFMTYNFATLAALADDVEKPDSKLLQHPFGYVVGLVAQQLGDPRIVWLLRYPELFDYPHLWRRHTPPVLYHTLELVDPTGLPSDEALKRHYETSAPYLVKSELDQVRPCVEKLQAKGLKVLIGLGAWLIYLPESHTHLALEWLKNLLREYGFDGFYLDNGTYGDANEGAWLPTYDFFRRLRREVRAELDKDLYLFHHNSNDSWGGRENGQLRAIMIDTYMNATLTGEVGPGASIDDPDDEYLRYHTCGYGFTQAFAHHKRYSCMTGAISEQEKNRVLAQHLHGVERDTSLVNIFKPPHDDHGQWQHYLQYYNARKAEYLSGSFDPAVTWPPDWYRRITDVQIQAAGTSATITWSTGSDATGYSVSCLPKGGPNDIKGCGSDRNNWWGRKASPGDTGDVYLLKVEITPPAGYGTHTAHAVDLTGLTPGTTYQLRIRSSNPQTGTNEIIWGWTGEFTTAGQQ